ncbi:MAG: ABC transporter ATP-binding protein [Lachnospiraceae bacterium]|nr:ABC transporter ATP-binding protein [Lachnospiraceae bacterium]
MEQPNHKTEAANDNYLELRGINKAFQDCQASQDVSFSVGKGHLVALLGPSGSGKTTILRMIAGLETADSGEILINGKDVSDVPASKRGVGFVFQNYALFRYKTVYDNIAFGLKVNKWKTKDIRERVNELISLIGLEGLEKRYPNQLSGGQRQRVAFARALAPNPELLLLDEPFAAIDAKVRQELRAWLREMINKVGVTSIFVTHDQDEAIEVADEIIITNAGRIEQIGSPMEIYRNPDTAFVAEFMGHPTRIDNIGSFSGFGQLGPEYHAVIRPENVSISKAGETLRYEISTEDGIVERVLFRGREIDLWVRIHGILVQGMRKIEEEPVQEGEKVRVFIYRAYVFGEDQKVKIVGNSLINTEETVII